MMMTMVIVSAGVQSGKQNYTSYLNRENLI